MTEQQHTLRDLLEFEGIGLHTGVQSRVTIRPQDAGTGLRFRLGEDGPFVMAHAENVVESRRATVIGSGECSVSTVEHLLSALFAMGVDNALIEVEGPEIPAMDGSAGVFARAIERVGTTSQASLRPVLAISQPFYYRDGDARLVVLPAERLRIKFFVDYAAPIGTQFFDAAIEPQSYLEEIAPARTFGYVHEIETLLADGLGRGGSLANALLFAQDGPLTPLRWPNEVVRHKTLDLIGDLALLGAWPLCEIISIKSGHRLHAAATKDLRQTHQALHPETARA